MVAVVENVRALWGVRRTLRLFLLVVSFSGLFCMLSKLHQRYHLHTSLSVSSGFLLKILNRGEEEVLPMMPSMGVSATLSLSLSLSLSWIE